MPERTVTISAANGMHARPAAHFVKTAGAQSVQVTLSKVGGGSSPANSILGLLSLQIVQNDEVVIAAEGEGAEEALETLAALLENLDD